MAAAERAQTVREEIANCITHGVALLASLAALPILVVAAARRGDPWQVVGGALFGATLILLYLASTLYHALRGERVKRLLRVLDHSAIYLLIAGTYTPFTLGVLRGAWGWALFGTIWTLALLGVFAKSTVGFRYPRLSTALYVAMGWLVLVAIQPLVARLAPEGLLWLVAGGLCYTGGVTFFVTDGKLRYGHAVWHLFVMAGSACHFVAVLLHASCRGA
jgi:hemolysin III